MNLISWKANYIGDPCDILLTRNISVAKTADEGESEVSSKLIHMAPEYREEHPEVEKRLHDIILVLVGVVMRT